MVNKKKSKQGRNKGKHKKKIIFLLSAVIVLGLTVILMAGIVEIRDNPQEVSECSKDSDCVPASCCHASECMPREEAPDCIDAICTMECAPGTLDCGQGSCRCIKGECAAVIDNPIE
jgi:hypothetical protein